MADRCRPNLPLIFSTDLTGILAKKPELYYQLIQTLSVDCCPIDGVELVPFRFSYKRVIGQLKKYQLPVIGIHGPPAWNIPTRRKRDNLIAALFASITPSLSQTFRLNQQLVPRYFLLHEPDLDQPIICQQVHQHFKNWSETQPHQDRPCLMIENVYREESLQKTIEKVKCFQGQFRSGLMLDLAHLLHQVTGLTRPFTSFLRVLNSENIDHYWQQLLQETDRALNQVSLAGLHLPLGLTSDGLPFQLLEEEHWLQLADLIDQQQKKLMTLVIENQHLESRLTLTEKFLPELIKDKKMKLKILLRTGVL